MERAFKELKSQNKSESNENIKLKTLDLKNELQLTKNDLIRIKQEFESLKLENQALQSDNQELMAASKNNIQVGSFSDGENCCFCSCKVDSLAESLNLIKINEQP